jgi:hypothetical protein
MTMWTWLLMLNLATGPHSIMFEKFEDCASSGNAFVDAYREQGVTAICMKSVEI